VSPVVAHALEWGPAAIGTVVGMDAWAAFVHGRVWHAWLWRLHASHHRARRGVWEVNDVLSLTHAPIAVALVLLGCRAAPSALREIAFGVGLGMTVFGAAYVVVHDGLVHGRLPVRALLVWPLVGGYLRRVVDAHRRHHDDPAGGAPFGLFLGPWELTRRTRRRSGRGPTPSGPPP
jgi:beta-carotene 3-hydroxylase